MESAKIKTSAIAQAEIQRRRRAQRMETAKIKTSTIAQSEIQRRRRAQRMETAKINTSAIAQAEIQRGVEHKGWKQQRLRLVLLQGRDHSAVCKTI